MWMLIATTSVPNYVDPWRGPDPILAGRTCVAEDSREAQLHPGCFEPMADRLPGAREQYGDIVQGVSLTQPTPRGTAQRRPRWKRDLGCETWRLHGPGLNMDATGRVRFAPQARAACEEDVERFHPCETGLLLFGRGHGSLLDVVTAVWAGPDAHRQESSFSFDPNWCRSVRAEQARHGLVQIGEAHSHTRGPALPSMADRHAFEGMRKLRGADSWVAVLYELNPDTGDWGWRAFIRRYGVTRPARIVN